MRVLVTRPGEDGTALAEILGALGVETIVEPLLTIKQIEGAPLELKTIQAILLTSANGVRALARRSDRRDIPVYAVGDATATTARSSGFTQVHSAAGNVETLADLVIEMLTPKEGPLLHVAGSLVAGDLVGLIEAAGFKCSREVLYEAVAERSLMSSTIAAIKDNHIDAVTLYSPRSAEIFVELIRKARVVRSCQKIVAICLSQAVADKIGELNWLDVRIAREPDQEALLELVAELGGGDNVAHKTSTGENLEYMSDHENVTEDLASSDATKNGQTGAAAASHMTHRIAPIQRRQGGTAKTVFITLLITAILIGAGMATKPLWLTKIQTFAPSLFKASETEIRITNLTGRLKALEDDKKVPALDALQLERKRLQTKLDATLKRLDELENSIGTVKNMIDAVSTGPESGAAEALKQLSLRLNKLESENTTYRTIYQTKDGKTLNSLARKLAALEKKLPGTISDTRSSEARAMVLSIGQLREAVRASRSFEDELEVLTVLAAKNENLKTALSNALKQLSTIAATGAPSLAKLASQFDGLAGNIVRVGLVSTDGGWVQRTLARLTESIKWRRTDNLAGNGVEAIVARAERALKSRDVEKTIKELSRLEGKPAEAIDQWLIGARAYVVAEKALAELQTRAVAQMAAGQ
jgi:uroporphyrinogen-III synthase